MKRRVRFRVSGRVQGVAYRASAVDSARQQAIVGWIQNLQSGEVEGVAQGEATAVDTFLAWVAKGPPRARVDRLVTEDEEVDDDLFTFEIRR